MAHLNRKKRKLVSLIVVSWLWTRLKFTIELTRLAFFRILPKADVHVVSKTSSIPEQTHWLYQDNQFSCVKFIEGKHQLIIYKLPPLTKN